MRIVFIVFTCFIFRISFSQTISFQEIDGLKTDSSVLHFLKQTFNNYKLIQLAKMPTAITTSSKKITLTIPGMKGLTFQGHHNSHILEKTKITIKSSNKTLRQNSEQIVHFNGKSLDSGNRLALSAGDDFFLASFESEGKKYFVEQLRNLKPDASGFIFVLYKDSDVIKKNASCANASLDTESLSNPSIQRNEAFESLSTTPLTRIVEFALAADYTTYVNHGYDVNNVTAYISSIINLVQGLYTCNFSYDLIFQITEIVVFTSHQQNPWPSTGNIYTNLANFRDLAPDIFTYSFDLSEYWFYSSDLSDGAVGLAYTPSTCNRKGNNAIKENGYPASLMEMVVAHEIGHNFNADHDPDGAPYIMAPPAHNANTWSIASINVINGYLEDSRTSCFSGPGFVDIIPIISAESETTFCEGGSVTLTSNISTGVQWYKNGFILDGFTDSSLVVNETGIYSADVRLTDCRLYFSNEIYVIVNPFPPPPIIRGENMVCEGSSLTLMSNALNGNQWIKDGAEIPEAETPRLVVSDGGSYSVKVTLEGCASPPSSTITVSLAPAPATPTVIKNDVDLISSSSTGNQWFLNGTSIRGATNQIYTPTAGGVYAVQVTENGCSSHLSNGIDIIILGLDETTDTLNNVDVYPNPVESDLFFGSTNINFIIRIFDEVGREAMKTRGLDNINLQQLAPGFYILLLTDLESKHTIRKTIIKK